MECIRVCVGISDFHVCVFAGGLNIPSAMLGIMIGGVILRRMNLSVRSSALMCSTVVLLSIFFAIPLLFLGCPTQRIFDINYSV